MELNGWPERRIAARILQLLSDLGLEGRAAHYPDTDLCGSANGGKGSPPYKIRVGNPFPAATCYHN
jgi:hypothetical protein